MTRQEFFDKLPAHMEKQISDNDYKIIEFVYTHHPSIDDITGKDQIAYLVSNFGMRIILDMYPTAQKASQYFSEIQRKRMELDNLADEYTRFIRGEIEK